MLLEETIQCRRTFEEEAQTFCERVFMSAVSANPTMGTSPCPPEHEVAWVAELLFLRAVARPYPTVNRYVYDRVRHFLRRRRTTTYSRGTRQFSDTVVFGKLRVYSLRPQ